MAVQVRMDDYLPTINWVKKHIHVNFDEHIARVHFDEARTLWLFYNVDGLQVAHLTHEEMNRIMLAMEGAEWLWADKLRGEDGVYFVGDMGDVDDHRR